MEKQVYYISYVSMAYIKDDSARQVIIFYMSFVEELKKKSLWNNNERKRNLWIKEGDSVYVIKE